MEQFGLRDKYEIGQTATTTTTTTTHIKSNNN